MIVVFLRQSRKNTTTQRRSRKKREQKECFRGVATPDPPLYKDSDGKVSPTPGSAGGSPAPGRGLASPNPYLITQTPTLPSESQGGKGNFGSPSPWRTLVVTPISCPDLCGFAPLREALPGLYHQSPGWERGLGRGCERGEIPATSTAMSSPLFRHAFMKCCTKGHRPHAPSGGFPPPPASTHQELPAHFAHTSDSPAPPPSPHYQAYTPSPT